MPLSPRQAQLVHDLLVGNGLHDLDPECAEIHQELERIMKEPHIPAGATCGLCHFFRDPLPNRGTLYTEGRCKIHPPTSDFQEHPLWPIVTSCMTACGAFFPASTPQESTP